ncbi:MAG: pyridoxal-phosphate dependent enzyme [Patescibacteria group bacterium]
MAAEVADSVEKQKSIVTDVSRPLKERIEAYEDIIDSEVGDTNLSRSRNIEREVGLRQIYLKFEGGNPTGTQKDRIAFAQVKDALRRGYQTITMATCGNYGMAIALAASLAGVRCLVYIPENYHTRRIREMENMGAEIKRVPGDYEAAVKYSRDSAKQNDYYDANPGGANITLQLNAYGEIANEIYDELRDAPAAVAVPVSNGTTLAGIHKGFLSLYRRGRTSRLPRIIAGSSYGKNPIVRAFKNNSMTCEDLPPQQIRETDVNELLINWHSIDGDLALSAIRYTAGWATDAADKEMITYARLLREREGLHVLPASTSGLIAMIKLHKQKPLPNDRYVVVLTGRRA